MTRIQRISTTKIATVLGVALVATSLVATPARAVPPPPVVSIVDGNDGYINASEEAAVMLTGTYNALSVPPVSNIIARIVSDDDGTCPTTAAHATPVQNAILDMVNGTWTAGPFNVNTFPQGPLCARARAQDINGNSDVGISASVIKDSIAPDSGTVTIETGGDGHISAQEASENVPISWSTAGDGVSAEITFTDSLLNVPPGCQFTDVANSGPAATVSQACLGLLADGPVTMSGVWIDVAGNRSGTATTNFTLDTTAPAVGTAFLADPNNDGYANKEEVQTGTIVAHWQNLDPDATESIVLFRDKFGAIHSPECGPFSNPENGNHVLTQACVNKMSQGPFELDVAWLDAAGNKTPSAVDGLILDTIMPVLTITEPLPNSWQPSTVTVRGLSDPNVDMTFQLDGGPVLNGSSNSDGSFAHTFTGVSDGPHFITVTATDVAANTIAEGVAFNVDGLIPWIETPAHGSFHPQVVTMNGSGVPDSTVEVWEGDAIILTTEVDSFGRWQTTTALAPGEHTVRARGIGLTGSPVSEFGPARTFTVIEAPPEVFIDTPDMSINPIQIRGTASSPDGVDRVRIQYFDAVRDVLLAEANADCFDCGDPNVDWIHEVPQLLSIGLVRAEVTAYDRADQASATKSVQFLYYLKL